MTGCSGIVCPQALVRHNKNTVPPLLKFLQQNHGILYFAIRKGVTLGRNLGFQPAESILAVTLIEHTKASKDSMN